LNEVKQTQTPNNSISIMGQKAEERLQKSRQKYKKLYN
jgi:aminoglycoside N3'-acetyltransferase